MPGPKHGRRHMMTPEEKPKNIGKTLKRLLSYMKKSILLLALAILVTIFGTVTQVLSPKLLGDATNVIFDGVTGGEGVNFSLLGTILLIVAGLYAGGFLSTFLQQRLMIVISQKITCTLRSELKAKMNRVPISYFDKHSNGNLMSVATNDLDNIASNLQGGLTQLISSLILVFGIFIFMLSISPLLTAIACIMIPGSIVVMKIFTKPAQKNNREYFSQLGVLNGHIEETYQGFSVIKGFTGEEDALRRFDLVNDKMYEAGWRSRFFGGSMMPSMMLILDSVYVLIAVVGAVKVVSGSLSIGELQAFLHYSNLFSVPMSRFSIIWNNILSAIASAERVFAVLDAEELPVFEQSFPDKTESYKVSFENVTFGYTDTLLMENFTLHVKDCEMTAIVGHTGAGKTTLINLLERFYEVWDGNIRINGQDIRSMTYHELRGRIGMVLQDAWLFSGSIYENILYGNPKALKEEVYAAAKAAYADEFIQKLPDGYDTLLNEDAGNISQGQRQLITIARAFLADPEILILDEATSNVDSRTEMIIQKAMKELMMDRTSFVVAHRLSTIYDADRIIVMRDGGIVETGTHPQLLEMNGTYAEIYAYQFAQKEL